MFAQGVQEISETESEVRGKLHVGISHTHAAIVPDLMMAFHEQYSGIAVKVTKTQADQLADGVASRRFDIGLCYEPLSSDGLVWEPFFEAYMVAVAATDAQMPRETTLANLSGCPLVLPTKACSTRLRLDRCVEELGLELNLKMEIDDPQALLAIVKTGFAIAILPETKVRASRLIKISRVVKPGIRVEGGVLLQHSANKTTQLFADFLRLNIRSILESTAVSKPLW